MKYNELSAKRQRKASRGGRGISAGLGKTAGRGTKGQGSRKSGGVRPGFEGGQMPLYMRMPMLRGFKSHKQPRETVYTGQLDSLKGATVNNSTLADAGIIESPYTLVKLLLKGDIKSKKNVNLQSASTAAIAAVEKAGGNFTKTQRQARPASKKSESRS